MSQWDSNGAPLDARYGSDPYSMRFDVAREMSSFMNAVYQHMALGLGATGVTAFLVASNEAALQMAMQWMLPLIVAQLALVFGLSLLAEKVSSAAAAAMFYAYAVLTGVTLSFIFLAYTQESIATTFFVTGGTFAAMSAWGYFTRRDLTGLGSFLFMGLIGLVLASLVNLWLGSEMIMWVTTYAGILIFVGLTAYDTQKLKQYALTADSSERRRKMAINGALRLYLDFINLFLMLLRVLGSRRD